MGIIKLFVVLCFLQICSADFKECKWVRTFACGGEPLSCIGRVQLGNNAHSSEEAEIVVKQVQENLKFWGQKLIGTIEKYTGECSFDPKLSSLVQGQKLCYESVNANCTKDPAIQPLLGNFDLGLGGEVYLDPEVSTTTTDGVEPSTVRAEVSPNSTEPSELSTKIVTSSDQTTTSSEDEPTSVSPSESPSVSQTTISPTSEGNNPPTTVTTSDSSKTTSEGNDKPTSLNPFGASSTTSTPAPSYPESSSTESEPLKSTTLQENETTSTKPTSTSSEFTSGPATTGNESSTSTAPSSREPTTSESESTTIQENETKPTSTSSEPPSGPTTVGNEHPTSTNFFASSSVSSDSHTSESESSESTTLQILISPTPVSCSDTLCSIQNMLEQLFAQILEFLQNILGEFSTSLGLTSLVKKDFEPETMV